MINYCQMINNSCQISPFIFIINILLGFYFGYFLYSLLFIFLLITSVIYHTYYTEFTYIIDKVSILYVVLYGSLLFYQKIYCIDINISNLLYMFMIVSTFLSVFYLYYYGYYIKEYCFNENIYISYQYQSYIHYITFLSHSLIMLL
jgi:hypothetical protein